MHESKTDVNSIPDSVQIAGRMFEDNNSSEEDDDNQSLRARISYEKHHSKKNKYKPNKRKQRYKSRPLEDDSNDSSSEEEYEIRPHKFKKKYLDPEISSIEDKISLEKIFRNKKIKNLLARLVEVIRSDSEKRKRTSYSSEESDEDLKESIFKKLSLSKISHYDTNKKIPIPEIKKEINDAMKFLSTITGNIIPPTSTQFFQEIPLNLTPETTADMPSLRFLGDEILEETDTTGTNNPEVQIRTIEENKVQRRLENDEITTKISEISTTMPKVEETPSNINGRFMPDLMTTKIPLLQEVGGTIPVKIISDEQFQRMFPRQKEITTLSGEENATRNADEKQGKFSREKHFTVYISDFQSGSPQKTQQIF